MPLQGQGDTFVGAAGNAALPGSAGTTATAQRWHRRWAAALAITWVVGCAGQLDGGELSPPTDPPPVDPATFTIDLDRTALLGRGRGVLLVGYDVEAPGLDETAEFLRKVAAIHRAVAAKATFFPTGWTLERVADAFRALDADALFEVETHTYAHERFKPLVERGPWGARFLAAAEPRAVARSVDRSVAVVRSVLGRSPRGITLPYGAFRGLADRPDLLGLLDRAGFAFVRSYGRNADDWQPVGFDVQPFWYVEQGFSRMLEIPIQGWQDALWREAHGWDDLAGYRRLLDQELEVVATGNLVWSYCAHDWSSLRGDPELGLIHHLLTKAAELGVALATHRDFYEAALAGAPPGRRGDQR